MTVMQRQFLLLPRHARRATRAGPRPRASGPPLVGAGTVGLSGTAGTSRALAVTVLREQLNRCAETNQELKFSVIYDW